MKHEIIDTVLNVSDTDITFDGIYGKPYIPIEYMDDIKKANLLIIPNEGFRDEGDVLFPETTREFFIMKTYLRQGAAELPAADFRAG